MDARGAFNRLPFRVRTAPPSGRETAFLFPPPMSNLRTIFLVAALGALVWWAFFHEGRHPAAGIAAPELPQQTSLAGGVEEWRVAGEYRVTALADYRLHARVLGVSKYRNDAGAPVAPVDLALGWGQMSDWAVYGRLNISQRGRYYLYEWGPEGPPIPAGEIVTHSANTHVIPADEEVARALAGVRLHDVVWMEGQLVEVHGPGGFYWRSSLTRTDTGGGSCELFRVRRLAVEPPPEG